MYIVENKFLYFRATGEQISNIYFCIHNNHCEFICTEKPGLDFSLRYINSKKKEIITLWFIYT